MVKKIVIVGVGVVIGLLLLSVSVVNAADWWNQSWTKKAGISINNTGGSALTNYQVQLNITYDGNMQTDFDDIRFVNVSTGTEEPYWIEDKSDSNWCLVWFNATYIKASGWSNTTTAMYYGNPSASSVSSGDNTFLFFDDFSGDLSKWDNGTEASIDSGRLKLTDNNDDQGWVIGTTAFSGGTVVTCSWEISPSSNYDLLQINFPRDNDTNDWRGTGNWADGLSYVRIIRQYSAGQYVGWKYDAPKVDEWHSGYTPTSGTWKIQFASDGTHNGWYSETAFTNTGSCTLPASYYLGFAVDFVISGWIDDVIVRKYTSPDPTAMVGTESDSPPPNPTNLQNTTGNFFVNYTWDAGSGKVTNSYNVSWNETWYNDTTNTFMNKSVGGSGWANITVFAYNSSDKLLSDGSVSDEVQAPATDTTFTVSLPNGYTKLIFEPPNSTATNYPPNGQSSSQEFYNVTNSGNVNLNIRMQLNTVVSTITLKADNDNNPSGAKEVNTTLVTIHSGLAQGNSMNIWLWSDFDHTPAQTANRTVYINVST